MSGELRPGDHACLLYDRPGEQLESVVPALEEALASGDRCVYVADDFTVAQVTGALITAGVDVRGARARRALHLLTKRDAYLSAGEFRPRAMVAFWERSLKEALADGFAGVTVTGEMAWALGSEPGSQYLPEYERLVSTLLAGSRAATICQYNARRFELSLVHEMLRVHPVLRLPLTPETDVVAVRRRGWVVAAEVGFAPGDLTLMWAAISELARSTVERRRRGELILRRITGDDRLGMRVIVRVDQAQGLASSLLPGLAEIERLMDEFEILSGPGPGATMRMTKWVR